MSNGINGNTWIRIGIPTALVVSFLTWGAGYSFGLVKTVAANERTITSLQDELDERAEYFNWLGESVEALANAQGVVLPSRPIVVKTNRE